MTSKALQSSTDIRPSLADQYEGRAPTTGLICIDTPFGQICWVDHDAPKDAEWFDEEGRAWPIIDIASLVEIPA